MIDGKGTGTDNAYMHLRQRAAVQVGDAVYTGQELGEVGETGDAVGCHLHFEEWTAPGWYNGGRPIDPLPDLKRWDRRASRSCQRRRSELCGPLLGASGDGEGTGVGKAR